MMFSAHLNCEGQIRQQIDFEMGSFWNPQKQTIDAELLYGKVISKSYT